MVRTRSYPGPFEVVQAGPVRGEVRRLQDLDVDRRAIGVEDQRGVAEGRAPAGLDEPPVHLTGEPAAPEPGDVVVVGAAGARLP